MPEREPGLAATLDPHLAWAAVQTVALAALGGDETLGGVLGLLALGGTVGGWR
jgi:hypothetical protein